MTIQPILPSLDSLQLRKNNPYSLGFISTFPDNQAILGRNPLNYTPNYQDKYFMFGPGDNLSQIAYLAYGDSKLWWLIADANNIFNPFQIPVGTELSIPPLELLNIL